MYKCIVTGATGHVGTSLVKELHKSGYQIKMIVLPNDDVSHIEEYGTIIYGNVLDKTFLNKEIIDADIVFHNAGIVKIELGKTRHLYKVNVQGTKNVVDSCLGNGIKRLVYTSSVHALPESKNNNIQTESDQLDIKSVKGAYAKSKVTATNYVLSKRGLGLEIVVVQPSGVIGPDDYKISYLTKVFIDYLTGKIPAYPTGGYNFVDVRNLAKGIRLAGETGKDGESYLLTGVEISIKQFLDKMSSITGLKPVKYKLPYWFLFFASYLIEGYCFLTFQKPVFNHYSITVLQSNCHFSNAKAVRDLGFTIFDIQQTIADTIKFVKVTYLKETSRGYKRLIHCKNRIM